MKSLPTIALISVKSDPAIETKSQNVYVRKLGEALSRLGWQVDMFTRKTDATQSDIVQHNLNCRTIRLTAGPEQFLSRQRLIGYLPEFLKQLCQFQKVNNIYYGLIHTNYWLSAWVGMEFKKIQPLKHVHTYHSLGAVQYDVCNHFSNLTKIRLAIEKTCLETADLTIATCPQQKEYLRELVSAKGNIAIIPYGIDTNEFGSVAHVTARKKIGIEPDVFNIFYVGRYGHHQGIETLLKAISKINLHNATNISINLVSSSHRHFSNQLERKHIENLTQSLGIAKITTLVEQLSREELAIYYAAADVCIVLNDYNLSGIVAMEAMASGTPVIASNVGGLKYVVDDEKTGLLYNCQDTFVLSQAICRMIAEPLWRYKLSISARERVEDLFTWDGVATQINEFYLELIKIQQLELLYRALGGSTQSMVLSNSN